jgi:hypothetical protein
MHTAVCSPLRIYVDTSYHTWPASTAGSTNYRQYTSSAWMMHGQWSCTRWGGVGPPRVHTQVFPPTPNNSVVVYVCSLSVYTWVRTVYCTAVAATGTWSNRVYVHTYKQAPQSEPHMTPAKAGVGSIRESRYTHIYIYRCMHIYICIYQ